ncbi:MAG: putative transrane protein, partial [Rhizobacter sp.]|nr:putative transrane protein [Rhizobacter sp.]
TSGQIADKLDKARLIRAVKWLEVVIALLACYGFATQHVAALFACTFLFGTHSSLFGPVKYAYLPQHLDKHELTGGNGMVEMGTFVSILLGNVAGGLLVAIPGTGPVWVAASCLGLAVLGLVAAHFVPSAPATDPGLRINWNPVSETLRNLRLARESKVVFRSLLGISWMWFFGAVFLTMFPALARNVLGGDEQVASLLLVVFSVGIGIGSLLCESLSRRQVDIGLVPFGAIGMSVFAIDLYFASRGITHGAVPLGVGGFMRLGSSWHVMADLALLSLFAGIYSVPMYSLIQIRSQPTHRSRIIAANNILNALFMIVSAGMAAVLLGAGFTVPELFLITGVLNAIVAGYIFMLVPEYLLRFLAWILTRVVYRFRVIGGERIPEDGAALLVANHVSFVDPVLLMAASPRPIVFIMDHRIFETPVIGWVFRLAGAIPVAPRQENPAMYAAAFAKAAEVLAQGDLLAIYPEGGLTRDGRLAEFKGGVMKILESHPVPVVPMALQNLWGSFFSRVDGKAMSHPFRRGLRSRVALVVGEPMAPRDVTPQRLHDEVERLLAR